MRIGCNTTQIFFPFHFRLLTWMAKSLIAVLLWAQSKGVYDMLQLFFLWNETRNYQLFTSNQTPSRHDSTKLGHPSNHLPAPRKEISCVLGAHDSHFLPFIFRLLTWMAKSLLGITCVCFLAVRSVKRCVWYVAAFFSLKWNTKLPTLYLQSNPLPAW